MSQKPAVSAPVRRRPDYSATRAIREALELRYQLPEWLYTNEITLEGRRMDAIAVRLWMGGALGQRVQAFEIKVSRGDWLRELQDFQKQTAVIQAVDDFFVVASRDVVHQEELPKGWGWIEWTGKVLRIKVQPALEEPRADTLPRELIARIADRLVGVGRRLDAHDDQAREAVLLERVEERVKRQFGSAVEKAEKWDALLAELGVEPEDARWADALKWLRTGRRLREALTTSDMWNLRDLAGLPQRMRDLTAKLEAQISEASGALADVRGLHDLIELSRREDS